ncbi:MAG TPA: NERD domain-containing protein [Myxococcota bacterium]|nr:NERD domain-containing protein [Myxococcota bacterium]
MADITGVWPRERPRPHESDGEATVYETLKESLPKGWTAWHSLKVRTHDGHEGEGDFVIAVPRRGMIVVEVKDGLISVRDGQWHQNGSLMKRPPRSQALGYAKLLAARLKDCGCGAPYAVATVFPDTPSDNMPTQDDVRNMSFVAQGLPQMCDVLQRRLDSLFRADIPPPTGRWIETLHEFWGETWLPRLSLGNRHELNEERRVQMDAAQRCLLDQTEKTRQALIFGMAGSGKTMLAREKAIHATREGRKVLFLCFTDPLAASLSGMLSGHGIDVGTVRRYAASLLQKAGVPDCRGDTPEFWNTVCERAVALGLPGAGQCPDMVVIDEAQDFDAGDWALVERLCRGDDGVFDCWAFCDMTQRYWSDRELPAWLRRGMVFDLETVYRCSPPIMALARLIGGGVPATDGSLPLPAATGDSMESGSAGGDAAPEDTHMPEDALELIREGVETGAIQFIETKAASQIPKAVDTEVGKLLGSGLQPGDIAILSLAGRGAQGSITTAQKMFGGRSVLAADNKNAAKGLVADTYLRFKGLERAAVIVTDFHLSASKTNLPVRLFIAMTRAQDCLRIVIPTPILNDHPLLRAVASIRKTSGTSCLDLPAREALASQS